MIYLELFFTFLKIGAFTFGGGYAMLPLIQSEVEAKGWMTNEELINFIAVSESTPGPFAVNISTYVGAETGGIVGSACATLGVVLPSFMTGLKPAVIGLIGAAVLSTGQTVFFPEGMGWQVMMGASFLSSAVIFAVMLVLALKKVNPILIIVLSAGLGVASGYLF